MSGAGKRREIMLHERGLAGRKQVEVSAGGKGEFVVPGESYIVQARQVPLTLMRYFVLMNNAMPVFMLTQ